jgi:hypothetical protein
MHGLVPRKKMKTIKLAVPLLVALAYAPTQSLATPLLSGDFIRVTVFANTYFTAGENTQIFGSVLSGGVGTTGAGSAIHGYFESTGAANIGASIVGGSQTTVSVSSYVKSGGLVTTGNGSIVTGNVTASGAANIGANAVVKGNVVSGGVGTSGANAAISGDFSSLGANTIGDHATVGGTFASGGLASTGAYSKVSGNVLAGGAASISATSTVGGTVKAVTPTSGQTQLFASPVPATLTSTVTSDVAAHVAADAAILRAAQASLTGMANSTTPIMGHDTLGTLITSNLAPTMTVDTTLYPGVYSAASWSTTAGTTLTLDGKGLDNQSWVFNLADILSFGGDTNIVLTNAGLNNIVVWNVNNDAQNGYASLGDGADVIGTIIANTYVMVGANATVSNVGTSCGGVYSQTSYVSTGANAIIGGSGCTGNTLDFDPGVTVPEPPSYSILLAGLALMGFMLRTRNS